MVRYYNFLLGLRDRDNDFNLLDGRLGGEREMLGQVFTLVVLTPHSLSLYVVIDRPSSCIVGMNGAE